MKQINYIECPHCGSLSCTYEFTQGTNEEQTMCFDCGYSYSYTMKRDDDNNIILIDNEPTYVEQINDNPYGVLKIKYEDGISQYISLKTEKDLDIIISGIDSDITIRDAVYRTVIDRQLVQTKIL